MIDQKKIANYHLGVIMTKMFEAVNLDFKNEEVRAEYDVFNRDSKWYERNEWTADQEAKFVLWLADYLYQSPGARRVLMGFPVKNKKRCLQTASQFAAWYGWKTKKDEAEN